LLEGKDDMIEACRQRRMKVAEKASNLLETRIKADGALDGMDVRVDMNCISGMPGESHGTLTLSGNLGQLLSVLARIWPAAPEVREIMSPGRQSWPDHRAERKENKE
jgi:hypothetical protein